MTYIVLITLCLIILLAYLFEISARYTLIPGVILLIFSGMGINYLAGAFFVKIPDLSELLPIMGTLGLILIMLEGSMDLRLSRDKKKVILESVISALSLLVLFTGALSFILVQYLGFPLKQSLLNSLTLAVISSAVAIPSAFSLKGYFREFVTYESSVSDIVGILLFDFILANNVSLGEGMMGFIFALILTIIGSVLLSLGLGILLQKINHHIKYVVITTSIILVYAVAKLVHLPSLLVVLIFGMILNNNHLLRNERTEKLFNFDGLNTELKSFKNITSELTFLIRSFFFIMFGFYTSLPDLLSLNNLALSSGVVLLVFLLRGLFIRFVLRLPLNPLLFFAPRGLITILLFLSIPAEMILPFMNKGLVTQVIFLTILFMTFGNLLLGRVGINLESNLYRKKFSQPRKHS